MATSFHAVDDIKSTLVSTVSRELKGVDEVALAIFPNHWNVGDSALWWAAQALLESCGIAIRYVCSFKTYTPEELTRRLKPSSPIILCGGGNFGDMYMDEEGLREKLLVNHKDRKIIQLPQSLWFTSDSEKQRITALVKAHPDFTLMVRDEQSLAIARTVSARPPILCPDTAFFLRGYLPPNKKNHFITNLRRNDSEASIAEGKHRVNERTYDWHQEDSSYRSSWSLCGRIAYKIVNLWVGGHIKSSIPVLWATTELSRTRTLGGLGTINDSALLITDRLHAAIFSILIDQETILIDNSYGKNKALYNTWLRDIPTIRLASSIDDIEKLRRELL